MKVNTWVAAAIAGATTGIGFVFPLGLLFVPLILGATLDKPWHPRAFLTVFGGCLFGASIPLLICLAPFGRPGLEMYLILSWLLFVAYTLGTCGPIRRKVLRW